MRRTSLAATAFVVLVTLVAGCTSAPAPTDEPSVPTPSASPSAPPAALATFYAQRLNWSACGGDFQCARLSVPVDYAQPAAARTEVALIRLRAGDPARRIGSLVVNPGGPGGSGVDYARAARAIFDPVLRQRYDIVGFDPRGVASSTPIQCFSDQLRDQIVSADPAPRTPVAVASVDRVSRAAANGCARGGGRLLRHVSTVDVAKDVDILRAALGDDRLNWFGASYGTYIGSVYASLFPTHVGRMVLDGAIDPTLSNSELSRGQAKGFEVALRRFVEDCANQSDCPLPPGTDAGVARIQQLFSDLRISPLPTQGRPLTVGLGVNAVLFYLYAPPFDWATLRGGLAAAFRGDGNVLLQMLDQRLSRRADGTYADNSLDALYFVNAVDRPDRAGLAETAALARAWSQEAPTWGAALAWSNLAFAYWPVPATGRPGEITAPGAPPILVVGTTYDPATPYPWAQHLAKQLSSGVLLTRVGDGHTAYGMGSDCADRAIDRYLTTGRPPKDGTICEQTAS